MGADRRHPTGSTAAPPAPRRPIGRPKPHLVVAWLRPDAPLAPLSPVVAGSVPPTPHEPHGRPRDPHQPVPHARWNGLAGRRRDQALDRDALSRFLRAYPRAEADAIFTTRRADGHPVAVSRVRLSQLIDTQLHPRRRQVVRLGIEERWPRKAVCAHLKGISARTYERDQTDALHTLLAALRE
jgi:hypothetical protein